MRPEITELLNQLLMTVLSLLVVIAGIAARQAIRWLQARYGAQNVATAWEIARVVAQAVEQVTASGGFGPLVAGEGKLVKALTRAKELGETHGIWLDDEQWKVLLEAAVLELRTTGSEVKRLPGPPAV